MSGYNFDKDTDFSWFKTYKWVELKDAPKVDSLRDKNIKEGIDAKPEKGLTNTNADNADPLVAYQAGVGREKQFTPYGTGGGCRAGWYRDGWVWPYGNYHHETDLNDIQGSIGARHVRFKEP